LIIYINMNFHILTIFPEIFNSYFNEGILKRAQSNQKINISIYNLRDWSTDNHKTVDDTPCGGGAGMVMKIEPLYNAIKDIKSRKKLCRVVLLSAAGQTWNQQLVKQWSSEFLDKKVKDIIFICGRYEGVDARLLEFIDQEISIGDYVLTGGELGAMIIIDSLSRLIPGVLGNEASLDYESHNQEGVLEYPQYTRPEVFVANKKEYIVPSVLMSGDHKKIEQWRLNN